MTFSDVVSTIHKFVPREVDCLILGGGITGAGIARDAAMRGLRVMLVDERDFASGTSHLTSKLIHGGLRYLEHGHVRPVIEGIIERDRLLHRLAPTLVRPMRFIMPFELWRLPKWLAVVCSLQLYGLTDWWRDGRWSGGMFAPMLRRDYPLVRRHRLSIAFWDAHANDARLVMATLRTAASEGTTLLNYTTIADARFERGAWNVKLQCEPRARDWSVRARTVVNATGPWSPMTARILGVPPMDLMWIKGSHILVRRPEVFGPDAIVIRSLRDQRPLWAVPWENRLIVGSTESRYSGDLREARPTAEEVADLFESFRYYFPKLNSTRGDILGAFAGVRPIIAQATDSENSLSRRHRIAINENRRLITVIGGKLTTFRLMAEQTVDAVDRLLGKPRRSLALRNRLRHDMLWPALTLAEATALSRQLVVTFPRSIAQPAVVEHLVRHYGHDAAGILADAAECPSLGESVRDDLPYTHAEIEYLCRTENVCHLLDLLKRRTPLYFLSTWGNGGALARITEHLSSVMDWDAARQSTEVDAVWEELGADLKAVGNPALLPQSAHSEAACA